MNSLLHFRSQKNFESILVILQDALPDNIAVQEKLETWITKISSYIKKLQKRWISRTVPNYSERDIRKMNLEYIGNILHHRGHQPVCGFGDLCNKDSTSWILRNSTL
jgi:hypothetical protein